MKLNARKRVLALLLTLAMLLPNFTGLLPVIQADAATTTYGEANVYDIYDLTGSQTNTIKGTDETWDGQIHQSVSAEHKENIVFKTKLTMGEQEVRLSLNALDGASIYDPTGYAVYINHNGGAPYITIRRNNSDLVVGSVAAVAGTWELEIGILDILTDGTRTGKHLYVKKDGAVVCEVDDTDGYLTGDALGTKIVDFHYGAAIQMDTTYTNEYGTATVYDIYDLTGAASNTIKGTDESWDGQIRADVSAEHKENFSFKTKLTMGTQNVRLSLTAKDGDSHYDPVGYAVYLYGADNVVEIRRNNSGLKSASVASLAGTYTFEVGIVDILFGGNRIGKHLYVKINDVVVCEYDDMDGYLTGDSLGTKIIDFHYGAAIQMDSTYTSSYGTAHVYDIFDLTGAASNTIKGTDESWDGQIRADVSAEHKENFSFKTKLTMGTQNVRLSLTAKDGDSHYDPVGYAVYLYGADNKVEIRRNNSALKDATVTSLAGTYTFEVGIVDILFGGNRIGKHLYVKINDVVVCEYDDTNGYLTGDTLGTKIIDFHYGAAIQMDSTYTSSYGTAHVYDIFDLTGAASNTIKGTDESWDGQIRADVSAEHKENFSFKTKLTMGTQNVRLSLTAKDGDSHYDPVGYAVYLYGADNKVEIRRNNSALKDATVTSLAGTYTFEVGIVDILFGGNRIGKHLYVKINDVVVCEYDDTNGYLTGDTLGTKIIDFHYGAAIQMDTTYATTYGTPHTYDIYDLTGSVSKTQIGTATTGNWSTGEKVGSIDAAHKENMELRANVTVNQGDRYRFSFGALDSANYMDLAGYGFELSLGWGSEYYLALTRNGTVLKKITFADAADYVGGAWKMEFGYNDVLINGDVVGKRVYLKKDGEEIISHEDGAGFLTGDTLGLGVGVFTYGNSVTLQSLYETTYADVNVYDIYDLTNAATNCFYGALGSQAGGSDNWNGTNIGDVASDEKENIALKAKVTIDSVALYGTQTDLVRLSLGALDTHTVADCHGYALRVYKDGGNWYYAINTDNNTTLAKSAAYSESDILGTYELEFGYQDILLNDSVIGKRIYLKKDGAEIVSCEAGSGYLTGDALGTNVNFFSMGQRITMETFYETSYADVTVYDIYDLTGKVSNVFYGTTGSSVGGEDNWTGTTIGNVKAEHKENVNFKAQVTVPAGVEIRFSLGALESANAVDYAGYALYIKDSALDIYRNNSNLTSFSVDMTGTYVLEFGIQDVMVNGQVVSKRLTVKKDGVVVGSWDDASGYLTGDTLGTKIAVFHYGSSIEMNSTLDPSVVNSYNLTLGGRTAMNLYLDTGVIDDPAATVTIKIEGEKASQTYALQDLPIGANGFPMVTAKLASGQMNDAVTVTITKSNGETEEKSYTVAGYANFILNGNYSDELKQLTRDMLHYGAAAQVYFNYNNTSENLANNGITENETNDVTAVGEVKLNNGLDGKVSHYGSSLILRDDTTLRHYLNITGDVNDYTFSINGVELTPRRVNSTVANYCVQYDGILPNRLGDVFTLIVSNGSGTMTLDYSPTNYMKRIYDKNAEGSAARTLVQELYDYYFSAHAYSADAVIDTPVVLDLYQVYGDKSVTVPAGEPLHLGVMVGTDGSIVEKELTNNMALRFKYTGGEGMRIQIGASTPEISAVTSGALFMSVPDNGTFGIANILDNGTWCNELYTYQDFLKRGQASYVEVGCVKVYTNGVYTHDRYYVRAAASVEALDAMVQAGTVSVYYDTTMRDNNGCKVIIRSRMDNGGDLLETTWTDDEVTAYDAQLKADAQNADKSTYDALEEKYPDTVDTSNTASSLAAAKNPTGSTNATDGDELILWAESGASKIVQDDDGKAATLAAQKNTLSIQMAKNEYEGAQLMLFGNRNVESYEIFVTDLTSGSNVITADNIRLYQLKYLTIDGKLSGDTTYDTPSQYAGEKLPDAMLPFAKAVEYGENAILAGNNQSIYVDVATKSSDAAGTYTGTIVVKTNTDQVYTLPISVVVQDVVMPESSSLGTYAPYLSRDAFSTGELDGSDEMASLYVQTLESFNMSSIIPESDDVMNIEKFLVNVRRYYDSTTNYLLPIDTNDSYYNGKLVYCNYALLKEYVVALAKMSIADGKNYLDKAFFYPSDHVDESKTEAQFALAKETYTAFCQMLDDADGELTKIYSGTSMYTDEIANSVKNLRFLLTIPGDDDYGKSLDIGDLLTDFLTVADRKNTILCTTNEVLVRDGYGDDVATAMNETYADELWTYLCLKPFYPYSNYAFDTPVVGLRTLGWTCYQENVDTLMTWKSVNYLYDDSGLSLDRWTTSIFGEDYFTPGDGNVFYPGAKYGIDGPCPSLRAMAWRDGVDDYNLMKAIEDNGGSADNLTSLYGLITKTYRDSIKASSETGSWWGSLISKTVNATVPIDDDAKFIIVRNALLQMAASDASQHAAIVANAQTAVNGVTAASGTKAALETPNAESSATITGNIYTDGYYQLADFETYEETIQNKFSGNAQLALSSFAQNGSNSLQVAVQPGQDGETVWIPTTSKYFNATTNFSSASKITFKIYNAQGTDSTVRFYLNTYNRSADDLGVYSAGTYNKSDADIWHDDHSGNTSIRKTLTHGWNDITINLAELGVDMSYVGAFVIAFDSGVSHDAEQVFYLDDVRVYMTQA